MADQEPACDMCGDVGQLTLRAACHPTAPLRIELLESGVLIASCYVPSCNREVARFKAEDYVPGEWKCGRCGVRRGGLEQIDPAVVVSVPATDPPTCPVDNSTMHRLTWREAAEEAGRIAAGWMKRARQLEEDWPSDAAMPVDERDSIAV